MTRAHRLTSVLLIASITLAAGASTGCSSMRPIRLATDPGDSTFPGVKAGDTVAVVLKDGRQDRFVVASVEGDSLISTAGPRYTRAEIVGIRRRSISALKTTLLVTGVAAGALFAIAAIAFATWDGPSLGL